MVRCASACPRTSTIASVSPGSICWTSRRTGSRRSRCSPRGRISTTTTRRRSPICSSGSARPGSRLDGLAVPPAAGGTGGAGGRRRAAGAVRRAAHSHGGAGRAGRAAARGASAWSKPLAELARPLGITIAVDSRSASMTPIGSLVHFVDTVSERIEARVGICLDFAAAAKTAISSTPSRRRPSIWPACGFRSRARSTGRRR